MEIAKLNPHGYKTTSLQDENLKKLCECLTFLEEQFDIEFTVNSGLRSKEDQEKINPVVKNSAHMYGEACDINDPDGSIWGQVIDSLDLLIRIGLYVESRTYTPRWVHFQTRPPKSGHRIFLP